MKKWIVKNIICPRWVSFEYSDTRNGENELGFSIFGVVVGLYKADVIYPSNPKNVRAPRKREFGESLHPISFK